MNDTEKLIARAQAHDAHAFGLLYKTTCRELGWYCKRLCGNDFDAQDLMQEVYLMAWEKLPQFAGGNFTAWLRTIAHHTFVNRLRKYRLELLTEELPDMPPEDELLGPVHITEQRALRRLLLQTIDSGLSPVQRMTVLLYYYDELPVTEIAARMECSEGTVKSRLFLARKKLREALGTSAGTLLGMPCILPVLRHSAEHSGSMQPLFFRQRILPQMGGKAAVLSSKAIAGIGAAAVLTVSGTAFVLHQQPKRPVPASETATECVTEISVTEQTTELPSERPVAAVTETSLTTIATEMTTEHTFTVQTTAEETTATMVQTAAQTTLTTVTSVVSSTLTEITTVPIVTEPETETTDPGLQTPQIPGFQVDAWEENGVQYARILPSDTGGTTERIKLVYEPARIPEDYAPDGEVLEDPYDPSVRITSYPHSAGGDALVFIQRTRSAASPLPFGDCFALEDYDLSAVSVGPYAGWLAVSRADPSDCTLEWDIGEYLFDLSAQQAAPALLLRTAVQLQVR